MSYPSQQHLELVSINTWKCDGNYARRMEILQTQLKKMAPDIVCCQEVFQSHDGRYDTIRSLARALKTSCRFAPLRNKTRQLQGRPIPSASGLGVLSRFDIDAYDLVMLPDHPGDRDRAAQLVRITKAGRRILVVNTHLTHLENQAGLRLEQVKYLLDTIAPKKEYDLVLVCGDFNADPQSHEIQYAVTHPGIPLVDLLAACNPGENLSTFPALPPGQASLFPPKRIDYIFTTSRAQRLLKQGICAGLALNHPSRAGLFASDHFGVFARVPLSI
jgi:endonuclease/exonuclease/phosphatase family metal-dependent hydrolase